MSKEKYRTLFISDAHLGTRISQSEALAKFLKRAKAKKIYLVGDIFDLSALRRKFYWDAGVNAVIRRLLKLVKSDVEIIYVPGNHDREIADFRGMDFAGIKIRRSDVHQTADGTRLLVVHGDEFDGILNERLMLLYRVGDRFYDLAVILSRIIGRTTRLIGVEWSLSRYLKTRVKNVVAFIAGFENLLRAKAKAMKVDGIVSGHIHTAALTTIEGIVYANCGCWTESRSAVAETMNGTLRILNLGEEGEENDEDTPDDIERKDV